MSASAEFSSSDPLAPPSKVAFLPGEGESIYDAFSRYNFSEDPEFLNGLESVISNSGPKTDAAREILVGEVKAFYFSRMTDVQVTWDGYLEYLQSKQIDTEETTPKLGAVAGGSVVVSPDARKAVEEPLPPAQDEDGSISFAKIADMIANGQTDQLPFNRNIEEKISTERPSEPALAVRKKPWET